MAPVAFYPDDLLAIVLPAATSPLQIVQAQRFLDKSKSDKNLKPDEAWDPSVLALLNYPEVIAKMNADLTWTEDLGNAVIDQQADVMDMIQQVRAEASAAGYLKSDEKQVVVQEKETIIIQPADPEVIYVPDYDPQVVYVQSYASYPPYYYYSTPYPYYYSPAAAFWTGAFIGAAFSYGFDWGGNDIDINVGGDNINIGGGDNINIGDRGDRGDRVDHRDGDRFNADKQRVNGGDKMKWNGNKARQKQTTGRKQAAAKRNGTLPASSQRADERNEAGGRRQQGPTGRRQEVVKSQEPRARQSFVQAGCHEIPQSGLEEHAEPEPAERQLPAAQRAQPRPRIGTGRTPVLRRLWQRVECVEVEQPRQQQHEDVEKWWLKGWRPPVDAATANL